MRRPALGLLVLALLVPTSGCCGRCPAPRGPQVIGPLPPPLPLEAATLPYEVPHLFGLNELTPSDSIELMGLRGDRPRLEVGGTYVVWGSVTRAADSAEALLMLWNSGGESTVEEPRAVPAGPGTRPFVFRFRLVRLGEPHLSLYPPGGGNSLGGLYFHPKP